MFPDSLTYGIVPYHCPLATFPAPHLSNYSLLTIRFLPSNNPLQSLKHICFNKAIHMFACVTEYDAFDALSLLISTLYQ
jgi:hypothetical protein